MLTFIITVCGSWWAAAKVRNGWLLLAIVPALAVLAATLSGLMHAYVLGDPAPSAVIAGFLQFMFGVVVGGIVAAVVRWRRRRRR